MSDKDERREFWIRMRMGAIAAFITVMLCAVIVRVYHLQVVQGAELAEKAVGQHMREIKLQARRGSILDRNRVELAVSVEAPSVFVRPREIKDKESVIRVLSDALELSPETVRKRVDSKSSFVWVKRQATPEAAAKIAEAELSGVGFTPESKRFYPLKERAGQLLGFVGIDSNGLEGIEQKFDSLLAGGDYFLKGYKDARGKTMLTVSTPEFREFEGKSVVLTIDERLQRVAEEAIREQAEAYQAKAAYAVVVDPKTGEVLAMANWPSFDPNRFREAKAADWRLRNVTDTFEPGSTFKPLVVAAALQEKSIRLNSTFDCENGRIRIGRYTIRDSHPEGILSVGEIVQESSNICSYKIAQTLGREKFYEYIKAFGFGRHTGLGMRGEQPGLVWPPDRWAEVSFANIAFGQGLTSTPLQMAMGIAAIANGGNLMKPQLIKEVVDKDGTVVKDFEPTLLRQVVSKDVAKQVAWTMTRVTKFGTGKRAQLEHFNVGGKTGTAQKVNPETRRYDPNMWIASFVGFAPAEDPEFVVLVMVDEPQKMHYGGVVAGPAFKKIMTEALTIRGVRPPPEDKLFTFDDEELEDTEPLIELETESLPPIVLPQGDGFPDFRGLTLREALDKSRKMGILPGVEGWGKVVAQTPEAGSPIEEDFELSLVLSPASRQSLMAEEPSSGNLE